MANLLFTPESLFTDYRRVQAKGLVGANGCSPCCCQTDGCSPLLHRQPVFKAVDVRADFGVGGQDGFDGRVQDVGDALFDVRKA
jgi:hypothetical protein